MSDRIELSEPLRVGVVGLGFAGTTHLDAFTSLRGVEVVALAGQESARLAELAATRGVPNTYADWQDLVARDDLDAVSIGVPNALHHPIAMAALESGKHVFCEKPLATTAALAEEMVEAARAADRVLEVAFNHRRRADVAYVAHYLKEYPIGRVYHARASWMRRAGVPGIDSWFTNKQAAGGGPLIDLGSHVLDIALTLLDEPRVTRVSAVAYNELGRAGRGGRPAAFGPVSARDDHPYDVEDFASALLRLDNGASLQLEASWASYSKADEDIEIELLGSEGGIRIFVNDKAGTSAVSIYRDALGTPVISAPEVTQPDGRHLAVIAEFVDAIRAGATRTAPRYVGHYGEYALHRSRVIDAAYASAAAGQEIAIDEIVTDVTTADTSKENA